MTRILSMLIGVFFAVSLLSPLSGQRTAEGAKWAHDRKHVVMGGEWHDPVTWKVVEPVEKPKSTGSTARDVSRRFREALETKKLKEDVVKRAFRRGGREHLTIPRAAEGSPGMHSSRDLRTAVVVADGDLWAWHDGKGVHRVTSGLDDARRFELSQDGSAVSYIKGYDLFMTRLRDGKTHRISDDGGEALFYGELDWVYQEEVYGRGNFKATWWSPTGAHIAYIRTDESGVDTFMVVDHRPQALRIEDLKYPKAGTTNPRATLWIARPKDGKKVAVDLSRYDKADEILIVRVGWTPEADACMFKVQNREQTWLDLVFADPDSGKTRVVIHEQSDDSWVNVLSMPRWLEDGTFIWESERTGFKHYYRYDRTGKLKATITSGDWNARRIQTLNEDQGWMVVTGTTPDYAIGSHAYLATLDGKKLVRLTKGMGDHRASVNHDATMVLDTFQHFTDPGQQWLRRTDGTDVRKIYGKDLPEDVEPPLWKQVQCRDGEWVDVLVTKPADLDPEKKYPVWISTYSGPDSPTIRDRYLGAGRPAWYVGLNVNVRSASGRGMKYTKACYRQFGVQELKDIEDAIDWLCAEFPWADKDRVGITGWSYGGFMAAFALTHSKKFKCGIAGAGVYGWDLYDTIYTERYMATPQNNPEGYLASSVVAAAKNLHGELLILHGMIDDNVHAQNCFQFVGALQKANKQNFQMMVYPGYRHGVGGRHIGRLRARFMKENL